MKKNFVCFGEVLWDVLPNQKIIGGAPMNVALRLNSIGEPVEIISRIGADALGNEIRSFLQTYKQSTVWIQTDALHGTGEVLVHLNEIGDAHYTIVEDSAWDFIEWKPEMCELISNSKAFIFGSLVCRNKISNETLLQLLPLAKFKVFDVNIRWPFYSIGVIEPLLKQSDFIKLNEEELAIVSKDLSLTGASIEQQMRGIQSHTNARFICVTRGAEGAMLLVENILFKHPGFKVQVADTIGAGDSFLAAMVSKILQGIPFEKALAYACAMGSLVASKNGANAKVSVSELAALGIS